MSYKIETHLHTSESSPCAQVKAAEVMACYAQLGYAAVTVTDHYIGRIFEEMEGSWESKVICYLKGYQEAKKAGDRLGINVLLGLEICFNGHPDDFLVYGFDEAFLLRYPRLYERSQEQFFALANEHGLFFAQAHPFRPYVETRLPAFLHGAEGYNGHPTQSNDNPRASAWAEENGLIPISGSDFHAFSCAGRGGIISEVCPRDGKELAKILFENPFTLIRAE